MVIIKEQLRDQTRELTWVNVRSQISNQIWDQVQNRVRLIIWERSEAILANPVVDEMVDKVQ